MIVRNAWRAYEINMVQTAVDCNIPLMDGDSVVVGDELSVDSDFLDVQGVDNN
jgi:hypothetical protein